MRALETSDVPVIRSARFASFPVARRTKISRTSAKKRRVYLCNCSCHGLVRCLVLSLILRTLWGTVPEDSADDPHDDIDDRLDGSTETARRIESSLILCLAPHGVWDRLRTIRRNK